MSFNDLARKRYSCRKLAAKPVEERIRAELVRTVEAL